MTAISEQAKELRELAKALSNTADIIEFLSAKLTAEHMERQAVYDGNGWVYCGDGKNLSAEKINLAAGDVCKHQVTFRGEDRAISSIASMEMYTGGDMGRTWIGT